MGDEKKIWAQLSKHLLPVFTTPVGSRLIAEHCKIDSGFMRLRAFIDVPGEDEARIKQKLFKLASQSVESNFTVFNRLFDDIYHGFASGRWVELRQAYDQIIIWENGSE